MVRATRRTLAAIGLAAWATACGPRVSATPGDHVWGGDKGRKVVMSRTTPAEGDAEPVLATLAAELAVNLERLQSKAVQQAAYMLAYDLVDVVDMTIEARDGELVRNERAADRVLDVDVRVGSRKLDNSHTQGGNYGPGNGLGSGLPVSMSDVELSLAQSLWRETERQYRDAVAAFADVESDEQLRSDDDREHPDFSEEKEVEHLEPRTVLDVDGLVEPWIALTREVSRVLAADAHVFDGRVTFSARVRNRYFVSSDGARVQSGRLRLRVVLSAAGQADDGMVLQRAENFEVHQPDQLPDREILMATAKRLRSELLALREAPVAEPYTGPAVLEAKAAGVFFHEIFGHRLEGHRQKDDLEGQTFTGMVGKKVLPSFLDVVDDPTVTALGGTPLSGHYYVDDEGVSSQRTVLVERGKLKGFLLSRSLVLPFRRSNGHGRREPGHQVVARQGNLIVSSRRTLSNRQLRRELLDEVKRQGKPYGLWFTDIEGGYTITERSGPQAFKVLPLMVYRVYPDGRADELVRGVDVVGTPLAAFETIVATGEDPGIFNGICGAESGWVPVSAVSPALLLRSIEIERAAHERDRPPLLPPPMSTRGVQP